MVIARNGQARATEKPANQGRVGRKGADEYRGLSGKIGKDALGNLAGEFGRAGLSARSGINQVDVPRHDLGEGRLRALRGVFAK